MVNLTLSFIKKFNNPVKLKYYVHQEKNENMCKQVKKCTNDNIYLSPRGRDLSASRPRQRFLDHWRPHQVLRVGLFFLLLYIWLKEILKVNPILKWLVIQFLDFKIENSLLYDPIDHNIEIQ